MSATNYPLDSRVEGPRTSAPSSSGDKTRRLRRFARARKRLGWALLATPAALVLLADIAIRGSRLLDLRGKHVVSYVGAILESAVLWGLLLYSASARRGAFRWVSAAIFVGLASLTLGCQIYFQRVYSTYVNL